MSDERVERSTNEDRDGGKPADWRRKMRLPEWVKEIIKQSPSIMVGILLALWVDKWKERRADHELAIKSLRTFLTEVRRNEARLDDVIPYHRGIRTILARADSAHTTRLPPDLATGGGVDGLRAPSLLETAWTTAVSTQALTKLDYETVAALSLTYTLQARVRDESRDGINRLVAAGGTGTAGPQLSNYTAELVSNEDELRATYTQAEAVIKKTLASLGESAAEAR
ncbi:MAG TPA: hypothetical protein VN706_18185 [Gemmatimonadaceae bacterium]|nr:hypothetical protein [Gemmatimonadaceae bacterium]